MRALRANPRLSDTRAQNRRYRAWRAFRDANRVRRTHEDHVLVALARRGRDDGRGVGHFLRTRYCIAVQADAFRGGMLQFTQSRNCNNVNVRTFPDDPFGNEMGLGLPRSE